MRRVIFFLLIACCTIGGEEVEKIATIETTAEVQEQEEEVTFEEGLLSFSQCMRKEGLDFPDPKPGEFGFFAFRDAEVDFNDPAFQDAFEICQPENPLGRASDE
jgi:hypothetical protein